MIVCKHLVEKMIDYMIDSLDPEWKKQMEDHLKRCPSCLNFMRTYHHTSIIANKILKTHSKEDLQNRIFESLDKEIKSDK